MLNRRSFNREEVQEHFKESHLSVIWSTVIHTRPFYFKTAWLATKSIPCMKKALENGWEIDEAYLRVRDAILLLQWVLGDNLTTELLTIGQNPVLANLMDIKSVILEQMQDTTDLQAVLVLVATKHIASAQTFTDPHLFMVTLLDELSICSDLTLCATEVAVRVELL